MIDLLRWASIIFAMVSATFWFWAASIATPAKVAATWDGGGSLQVLADGVRKQSRLNGIGAFAAACAVLLQAILEALSL